MELGQKIKIARENKNLTKTELAKEIGVRSAAVISGWESGISKPSTMQTIKNLSVVLDLSLHDIFCMDLPKEVVPFMDAYQTKVLSKLESLDAQAKIRIMNLIDAEYNCYHTTKSSVPVFFQLEIKQPLFITQKDQSYKINRQKIKTLEKERKKKQLEIEWITQFLWMIGFDGLICIADVCAIFNGTLVPSNQLCNCIYLCVSGTYKEKTPKELLNQLYSEDYNL